VSLGPWFCGSSVVKVPWTQGNAVPVPPIIEIQRSHTSNFIKMLGGPQSPVEGPKLMYSSLTSDCPLSPLELLPSEWSDVLQARHFEVGKYTGGRGK